MACGVLYAHDVFQVAALAQLTSNVVLVLAIGIGGAWWGANSLALGVVGGAFASTCIYTVSLIRVRRQFGPKRKFRGIDFRSLQNVVRIAGPLLASVIATQCTSVVVNRALSRLPRGTLAAFGYSFKLCALVTVIPTALSTVLFPRFSASWYSDDRDSFPRQCARALRAVLYIAMPLTCICFLFSREIVTVLFQRGAFTLTSVNTASVLFGLLILNGPAIAVYTTLARTFYAIQAPRCPVSTDIGGNLIEVVLVPWMVSRSGAPGGAFAYSLLPWITGASLFTIFKRRFRSFPALALGAFVVQVMVISAVSSGCGWLVGSICSRAFPAGFQSALAGLALGTPVALFLYYIGTSLISLPEADLCTGFVRKTGRMAWSFVATIH